MLTLWCFLAAPEWVVLDTFCVVHYNPLLHMDGESGGELYPCLSRDMLLTVWLLRVSREGFLGDQQTMQHSWKYFS